MASQAGAREGDWKCGGCGNRNYAFRSICNRCKQARLLVDSQTPADSKWLPRIGDWICAGCSNNNYASREKCNKCGQPKATGAFSSQQGLAAPSPMSPAGMAAAGLNMGMAMPLGMPSALGMPWPWGGSGGAGMTGGVPAGGSFRVGDWICTCGFHNYSSRLTCRQCHAPSEISGLSAATLPPAQNYSFPGPGKRLASDDAGGDWANKRLNMGGDFSTMHHQYLQQQQQLAFAAGLNGRGSFYPGQPLVAGLNVGISGAPLQVPASLQLPPALQAPISVLPPALLGKGLNASVESLGGSEQSNGESVIGCAQVVATTILHPAIPATAVVKQRKKQIKVRSIHRMSLSIIPAWCTALLIGSFLPIG